jgi:hypothetical protein
LVWDKYYTRNKLPIAGATFRGSYWWREILKLTDQLKGIAMVTVRDGKSCFLWHDLWDGIICSQVFPELFSFTKNQHISVFMAVTSGPFHDQFHLPLSPEAYAQYLDLELLMQELHLQNDTNT